MTPEQFMHAAISGIAATEKGASRSPPKPSVICGLAPGRL